MNGKVSDGDGLKEREGYKQRRRAERERVCVRALQTACWNERADRELHIFPASSPAHSPRRGQRDRRRVGGEKCGGEVVIKGEAEGGGRER